MYQNFPNISYEIYRNISYFQNNSLYCIIICFYIILSSARGPMIGLHGTVRIKFNFVILLNTLCCYTLSDCTLPHHHIFLSYYTALSMCGGNHATTILTDVVLICSLLSLLFTAFFCDLKHNNMIPSLFIGC